MHEKLGKERYLLQTFHIWIKIFNWFDDFTSLTPKLFENKAYWKNSTHELSWNKPVAGE